MKNYNPNLDAFLKIYSQSLLSTGLTRGLDEKSYIETKLDTSLQTDVLEGKKKLVVLTGNAGDGKTAFIQLIEKSASKRGATFGLKTENGCKFQYDNYEFETLYDGSQDYEGQSNDSLLKSFFKPFEGNKEPDENIVKIIAINEGKLRDFILGKKEYNWLGKHVFQYLQNEIYVLPDSLAFINLNNRAVVEFKNSNSIFDKLLDIILDKENKNQFWVNCNAENCEYSEKCYVKHNIDTFNDNELGVVAKQRLKEIVLVLYLKRVKHITMRDIRSLISYVLFNKYTCGEIQFDLDNEQNLLSRYYYNNGFNKNELDRMIKILGDVDVSDMPLPKIENQLYFLNPKSSSIISYFSKSSLSRNRDLEYLEKYFLDKPEGTNDEDITRKDNADKYLRAIKRKIFFEGNDDVLKEQFEINHYSFLPYKYFNLFINYLNSGNDQSNEIRNNLVLAISKSEKIYNEIVGRENICISSSSSKKTKTKAFYSFKAADFEVVLPEIGHQKKYIEYFPDHIIFRHVDKSALLEINIDLFEILMRIKEGYVPTSTEIQTFFLNLEMFKRRILAKRSTKVILTEDDANLYSFEKSEAGKLVLNKI
ncbi:MAG: hypothetical protein H6609_17900 [Ignavibacteriales bacterium]|nr:hypothetical protein [Ignavibacteriales bacterium]